MVEPQLNKAEGEVKGINAKNPVKGIGLLLNVKGAEDWYNILPKDAERLFHSQGIKKGDRIGIGFNPSKSYPRNRIETLENLSGGQVKVATLDVAPFKPEPVTTTPKSLLSIDGLAKQGLAKAMGIMNDISGEVTNDPLSNSLNTIFTKASADAKLEFIEKIAMFIAINQMKLEERTR